MLEENLVPSPLQIFSLSYQGCNTATHCYPQLHLPAPDLNREIDAKKMLNTSHELSYHIPKFGIHPPPKKKNFTLEVRKFLQFKRAYILVLTNEALSIVNKTKVEKK